MSEPIKTKEEIVRLSWLTELRRQGHRQCEGAFFIGHQACALGILGEVGGLDRSDYLFKDVSAIGALADLNDWQVDEVINMNDGIRNAHKHTFAEIADVVEGWFK